MSFSVLAIFKNESLNLEEWIKHYLSQNVQTIYLIDNGSTDEYQPIIEKYNHQIKLFNRPERYQQEIHYNSVYADILKESELPDWLFVVDLDEFVFCPNGTISDGLKLIPSDISEVYIPEQPYGSSGFVTHPSGNILGSFLHRQPETLSFKTCFKINLVKVGELGVHETERRCEKFNGKEIFKLNHYLIQSRDYFENVVLPRGDVKYWWHKKTIDYFIKHDTLSTVYDDELAKITHTVNYFS